MTAEDGVIQWKDVLRGAGLLTAVLSLLWGLFALLPTHQFADSPLYRYQEQVAPEWVWGAVAALSGALQVYSLTLRRPCVTYLTSVALTGFHSYDGALFLAANPFRVQGWAHLLLAGIELGLGRFAGQAAPNFLALAAQKKRLLLDRWRLRPRRPAGPKTRGG